MGPDRIKGKWLSEKIKIKGEWTKQHQEELGVSDELMLDI